MARVLSWSGTVEDDRGARFSPRVRREDRVSLRLLSLQEVRRRRTADPARHAASLRLQLLRRRGQRVAIAVALIGIAVVITGFAIGAMIAQPHDWAVFAAVLVFSYTLLGLLPGIDRRERARIRREQEALPPACLVCAYDLTRIPDADDGCTVCPECGAAWDSASMG